MASRDEVLSEIRRLAIANDGRPVGRARFSAETGIPQSAWLGRYWLSWNDAIVEAGLEPNEFQKAVFTEDEIIARVAELTLSLARYPTIADREMKRRSDPSCPGNDTIKNRVGGRPELLRKLVEYANTHAGYEVVLDCCAPLLGAEHMNDSASSADRPGYVYLIRMDKWFKLGCTTDILRRQGEIRLTLPVEEHLVHSIQTDDPFGVERYWHQRFAARRTRGEWFELKPEDVKAFKRWRRIF